MSITKLYFSSSVAEILSPKSINNNRIIMYPIRLFPSMNGWLINILSIKAAAFSIGFGYKSIWSNV